jgi:hypothetical protein
MDELHLYFGDEAKGLAFREDWEASQRKYFTLNGSMAGYWKQVWNTTVVAVQGGGHLLPRDQPARALKMLESFLGNGAPSPSDVRNIYCDTSDSICDPQAVADVGLGARCALLFNCSGHGACLHTGQCKCNSGWTGVDCSHGISHPTSPDPTPISVPAGAWHYHVLPVVNSSATSVTVTPLSPLSGLIVYALQQPKRRGLLSTTAALPSQQDFTAAWTVPTTTTTATGQQPLRANLDAAIATGAAGTADRRWVLGIFNNAKGFHAPTLNYTLAWSMVPVPKKSEV